MAEELTHEDNVDCLEGILRSYAGLDPTSDHGRETAARYLKALDEMTRCKNESDEHLMECIKWKTFESDSQDMVTQLNVSFTSLCNHHLVPFTGVAHIAYVPDGRLVGLSKLARVVGHYSRQLQVQEELTSDIANYLQHQLNAKGVAVWMQATHMCISIRGVQAHGTTTVTSKMTGVFADHSRTAKAEFLQIVSKVGSPSS